MNCFSRTAPVTVYFAAIITKNFQKIVNGSSRHLTDFQEDS